MLHFLWLVLYFNLSNYAQNLGNASGFSDPMQKVEFKGFAVRSTNYRSTGQQAIDRKRSEESTVHTLRDDQVVGVFGHFTVGGRGHWPLAQLGLGRLPCSLPDPPPPPPSPPPPLFLDPSLCGLAAKKQAGRDNRAMRQKIFPCVFLSWQSFGIFWNSGQI